MIHLFLFKYLRSKFFLMNTVLHTYIPDSSYFNQTTWWCLGIVAFCAIAFFFNIRRKQSNTKNLISMLLGFIGLIAIGSSVFSFLTSKRIGQVRVYEDRIETSEGTINAKQIKKAYIHESTPSTPFKLNELGEEALLLLIEEKDGQVHVFSEQNYDIQQMLKDLRPWLKNATGGK